MASVIPTTAAAEKSVLSPLIKKKRNHWLLPVHGFSKNRIESSSRINAGYTLVEMILALTLTGLLLTSGIGVSIGVYDKIETRRYNAECEELLNEILAVRNAGMMENGLYSGCKFYQDSVVFYHYDAFNKRQSRRLNFETFTIKEVSGVLEIRFDVTGTISRSTTLTLISEHGQNRRLVFQVAGGRIYLTDAE